MNSRPVRLIDPAGAVLASALVTDEGDHFGGAVDLRATPAALRALFHEFEEVVNGQMFAFLDAIQDKIAAVPVRAVFDDGPDAAVWDLQVFPSTGDISFRVVGTPTAAAESA